MLYFLKKTGKSSQRWGLRPQTPIAPETPSCYSHHLLQLLIFEEACSANVISIKKEQKELRNITNVLLLPLVSYFKLCAGYPNSATGSDFSAS